MTLATGLLARIGAGRSLDESYLQDKWANDIGSAWAADLYVALSRAIDFNESPSIRARQARAVLDDCAAFTAARQPQRKLRLVARNDHMVYLLYDADSCLLYVGVTDRGPQRLLEHHREKAWFAEVYRIEFERCGSRRDSLAREAYLIERLHPVHNVQHNRRRPPLVHEDQSPRKADLQ